MSQKDISDKNTTTKLSARDAAKVLSCAPDYIGKLCREGKLNGELINNVWHVDRASIDEYQKSRELQKSERSSKLANERRAQIREHKYATSGLVGRFFLRVNEHRGFAFGSLAVGVVLVVASTALAGVMTGYHFLPSSQSAALARVESPFFAGDMPSVSLGEIATGVSKFFASIFAPKQPTNQFVQNTAPVAQTAATTSAPVATATKPAAIVTNTYPVIERTVERVVTNTVSGVSQDAFDQALNALRSQIANISSGSSGVVLPYAPATRIDKLSSVAITGGTITNAAISGGSISNVSLSTGDLSGIVAIANGGTGTSSAPSYGKVLLGNASGAYDLVATSSLGISGVSTFKSLTDVPSTITAGDIFYGNGSSALVALPIGTNGQILKISGGVPTWGSDLQGAGGAGAWATTTDNLALYPADTTQVVIVGNNATTTTGNILEVTGSALFRSSLTAYNTITAPRFIATSTTLASTFAGGATFAGATSTASFAVTGSTTISSVLNLGGALNANSTLTVAGNTSLQGATSTSFAISGISSGNLLKTTTGGAIIAAVAGTDFENALTFTYPLSRSSNTVSLAFGTSTSNTWGGTQTFTNTPVLGTLSGLVGSNNGALYQIATSTDFVTSLAAGAGISLSGTAGAVTVTNTIGYPFVGNATTTTLTLSGGILTPTTTIGVLNATSSATLASTTLSGNSLFTNATTTSFAISGISSGSILKTTTGGAIIAAVAGTDYATFGYLFPNNATTTQLAFNGGATFAGATTTALAVTGSTTIQTLNLTNALGAAFGGTGSSTLTGLLVGNGTGALQTATISSPLALSGTTLSIQQATAAQNGYLSSTDWSTFNNKISSTSLSAGAGISYDSSTGVIANLIGYPFVGNATTTTLTLSGGILTPTTTIGVLNATSSATLASTTLSGNTLLTNATTTNFFATLASTTNLFANGATTTALAITNISSGSILKTTTGGAIIAAVAGTDYSNFGYLFPSNATTTSIAFNGGLTATGATLSSTTLTGNFVFANATGTNATTTNFFSTSARFTTASTTNLVISGLGNGSTQCLQINGSGTVSGTGSACGAGGGSFSYPFPNNATTTQLAFDGGATFAGATTTALAVTGSTTVSSVFSSTLANYLASTTLGGNTLLTNATTTNFAATNLSIGTLSGILKATSGIVSAAVAGTDYTTPSGVASSIAAAFPFTATTNFGAAANSTSTPIWFVNGLQASSTSQFAYASTTALTVNGSFYGASLSACDANTQKLLWSNGTFSCGTDQNTGGGGGSFPFSADSNYGQVVYSTSTPTLWLKSGIFASSTSRFVDADFTSATTTNLAVTGVTSSLLKTLSSGAVVAAVAGTDYTNFGYLFPSNATTTFLSFGGGASTTQLSVFNRAYFGATGTTTIDSTGAITVTSNSANTFPYASSTALSVSAALYTPVTSALLKTDSSGRLTAAVAGTDYQTFAWPFTPTTNFGAAANSTSTAMWFTNGLQASSTSRFSIADFSGVITSTATGANTFPFASTTALSVSGSFYGASLSTCNTGADKLLWNNGTFSCGTDAGASGTTEINWAFFNGSGVRVATSSNQVLIGFTSTSTNSKLEVVGGATFDSATTTALYTSGLASFNGNVGLGTTTPYSKLSIVGGNVLQTASGNPTLAATVATTSTTHSYASVVSGRYLYSADYEAGLRIIDISNPKTAASVGSYNTSLTHARGVAVAGKYAYVADDTAGLVILDVSSPASIKLVGSYSGINAFGIALSGRYVFIPDNSGGVMRILDVSDPTSPRLVSSLQPNVASQPLTVAVQGKFAYLGDNGTSRVYAIDISNPASPSIAGSYVGNSPIGLYVSGKYLYVADNGGGLYILNIATSNGTPTLVGTLNGTAQYYGVQVAGDYAYIADRAGNLVVADVSNPASPTSVGTLAVGDQPNGVTVAGKYAYVAANGNSTKIVNINGAQLPTASIGAIESNTANISDTLTVGGDASFGGGIDVGISGILSRGTIAAYVASSTQTNPTVASFIGGNVGIGTTSPYAALSVAGQSVFNYITATGTTASSFAGGVNLNGGATSTSLAVTGSTTISSVLNIGGQLNANLSAVLASTTLTGNSLFTNATTTNFFATLASTTNLFANGATTTALAITNISSGNLLKTTTGGAIIAAVAGTDYVTGAGLTSAFPFTATTNFGGTANSTSTAIWFQNGLQASSTAQLGMVNVFGTINFASTSTTTLAQFNGESLIAYNSSTASHAFGNSAGGLLSTNNTAIGSGALQNATSTGDNSNTAVGSLALRGSTSNFAGIQNTAVGRNALLTLSTGSDNSALGVGALGNLTSGSSNAAVGTDTFSNLTTGSFNSAFGVSAGGSITGDFNSLFGYGVGGGAGANRLTLVGSAAGSTVTGDNNTFLGYNSGRGITTGYANIMLGAHLSNSSILTTGSGNIGIGNELYFASSTTNNQLNIGNLLFGSLPATSTVFAEATAGALGVATSSPFAKFSIHANASSTSQTLFAIGSTTLSGSTFSTSTLFVITNAGNVGIGTSSPTQPLSVAAVGGESAYFAGYVGIGTNNPANALHVRGSTEDTSAVMVENTNGGGNMWQIAGGNSSTASGGLLFQEWNGGNTYMVISGSGNVGIGTTSPFAKLSVNGNGFFGGSLTATTITATTSASLASTTLTGNSLFTNATTTSFAITNISSGNLLKTTTGGAIIAAVAGTDYVTGAGLTSAFPFTATTFGSTAANSTSTLIGFTNGIYALASSTIGAGGQTTGLTISGGATTTGNAYFAGNVAIATTSPWARASIDTSSLAANIPSFVVGSSTRTDLVVTQAGRVGIGTAAPSNTLEVAGSVTISNSGSLVVGGATRVGATGFVFAGSGSAGAPGLAFANNTNTGLFLATNDLAFSAAGTEWVRITSAGNVGISTTSPYRQLSVGNNAVFGGDVLAGSFTATSSASLASTTLTGSSLFTNATTTSFAISGISSGSILKTTTGGAIIAAVAGTDYVTGAGLTSAFPFTATTNFGGTANSTSTAIWFQAGLQASSTARLSDISTIGTINFATTSANATSTLLTLNNAPLVSASTTAFNTTLGQNALVSVTGAVRSTAIGYESFTKNTSGSYNTGLGYFAGGLNSTGQENVALGYFAGGGTISYSANGYTAVGASALGGIRTGGDHNTAVGYLAGSNITTGYANILLGASPSGANNLTTGSGNIGLGNELFFPSAAGNNQINIAGLLFGTAPATSTTFRLPTSGSLGVGTSSPFAKFSIQTNNGDTATTLFAIGSSTASATTTLFSISNTGTTTLGRFGSCNTTSALTTDASGNIICGTISAAGDGVGSWFTATTFGSTAANATSTLTGFTNGIYALASSTIGGGSQTTGLTISGGATTTGNAYIAGLLTVLGGTSLQGATSTSLAVTGSTTVSSVLNLGGALNANGALTVLGNTSLQGATSTSFFASSLLANVAAFGQTATSSFNSAGVLNIADQGQSTSTIVTLGGVQFLSASSSSVGNLFLGLQAGEGITRGTANTGIGYQALSNNTSGTQNTANGYQALFTNTTGGQNTATGYSALLSNTTGNSNTAYGHSVLNTNNAGNNNTGLGWAAFNANTTGSNNTGSGYGALFGNTTGSNNTATGYRALFSNTTATYNTSFGYQAGYNVTTGYGNVLLGATDVTGGSNLTTGSGNISLGYNAFLASTTANNQLNIGNILFGTLPATSTVFAEATAGALGVATSSPFAKFAIHANASSTSQTLFAIGSTTLTGSTFSTSTLFSISNTGLISGLDLSLTGGATSTALAVTGSTTISGVTNIGGQLNANLSAILASTTLTGSSLFTNATTTSFAISGISSGSILKTTTGGAIIAAVAGTDYVTGAGLTSAFPFTATTFGSTAANSTSTLIGFTNGIYALASSTIGAGGQTTGLTISGGATTTNDLYVNGAIGVGVQNSTAGSVRTNTSLTVGTTATINGTSGNLLSFGGIASGVNNIVTANIGNLTSGSAVSFTSSGSASSAATGDVIEVSRTRTLATSLADTNSFLNLTRIYTANGNGNNFRNTGDLAKLVSNCSEAGGKCFDQSSVLSLYQFATSSATTSPVFNLQSGGLGKLAALTGTSTGNGVSIQIASTSASSYLLDLLANGGASDAFRVAGNQAIGVSTSSPFARFAIHTNPTDVTTPTTLFAIGSSTASATSTLFSISNTGSTTLYQIPSSILKTNSNGTIIAAVAGTDYVTGAGLTSAFPFTATTFGSTAANSTSTLIGFTNGIYALASSTIGAGGQTTGLTISGGATTTGNAYFGGQIFNSDGSASAPAVSFLTDTGLGMYRAANDTLGFATNGTARLYISNSEIDALYPVTSQITRGFYLSTTAVINASAPPYAFDSDTNTGMRSSAADTLEFVTGGVDRVTVTSTGNFGVGSSSPFSRLTLHANNGDTNTTLFAIGSSTASATTTLFSVLNTGAVGIGSTSPSGIFGIETSGTSGRLVEIRNTSTSNWAGGTSGGFLVLRSDAGGSATGNYVINYLLNGTSQQFGVDASGRTHVSGSANASNPGLAFIGDTDTGLFSASGTNIIGFSTGGRERARLTATGGFTIGTSTSYATTTIWSNSLVGKAFEIVNNASTTLLSVSSAGFGTTTVSGLSISGSATSTSNVGFDISSGCFAVNGTCLASAAFTYPFPDNATSTLLTFSGGLLSTASTTIGAGGQTTGLTISGGATTTGSFVVTGAYASTTKFYANGLTTCQSGSVLTYDGAGTFGCATDQTAAGGWPFTPTTFGSTAANATSTLIGFTQGIYALASSTIGNGTQTGGLTISGGATTTATSTLAGLLVTSGNVGIGTLTPTYKLDVSGTLHASGAVTFDSTLTTGAITINSGGAGTFGLSVNPSGLVSYNSSDTIFGEHRFAFGGTTLARIMANGNVGIGTTTPYAKLSVFAGEDYLAAAPSTLFAIGSTTAGTATTTLFSILSSGNVGIGTSSPGSRLSLTQAASVSQFTLAYDSSNATYMRTDSVGDLWIVPSGTDAYMTNGNLWVCTGGSITSNACPSGTPSGAGNLIVQNRIGVGTSTPSTALTVYSASANAAIFGDNTAAVALGQGTSEATIQGYTTTSGTASANLNLQPGGSFVGIATTSPWGMFSINPVATNGTAPSFVIGSSTATRFIVTNAGNVGVGTTSPSQQLSVGGKLFVGNGAPTGMGTATSTFQGDVLITGKLDVSTIDPVYTIDGVKYATYGLSSVGIKEETSATITLAEKNAAGKYEYAINFSEVEKGSDLWLFYQVTTFGEGWKDLVANLTPGFDGSVHYVKDPATNTLRIIGDAPGEVSVRLVSSRFDGAEWPNLRPDQNGGFSGFQLESK